jgi:endonuclease YncB( thermonuclease family)
MTAAGVIGLAALGGAAGARLFAPSPPAADAGGAVVVRGVAEVIDGDTLRIGGEKVRLYAIDAPEARQTCERDGARWDCGGAAARRLVELVAAGQTVCVAEDRDRYGRLVARCTVGEVDLGRQLVAEGLARAYVRYGDEYAAAEADARLENVGLWRGKAEAPWDYRADKAAAAAKARPAGYDPMSLRPKGAGGPDNGCRIKGNISSKGDRIYHLPGEPSYARTRIDLGRGEAWFCDEAAARAAGFRAAGR